MAGAARPRCCSDATEISRPTVDLAVVAVPNHRARALRPRTAAAGIPVFVEKPVCLTVAEADQLAAAERVTGVGAPGRQRRPLPADVQPFLSQRRSWSDRSGTSNWRGCGRGASPTAAAGSPSGTRLAAGR